MSLDAEKDIGTGDGQASATPVLPTTHSTTRAYYRGKTATAKGTKLTPEFLNSIIKHSDNLITGAGLTLDDTNQNQWYQAVYKIASDLVNGINIPPPPDVPPPPDTSVYLRKDRLDTQTGGINITGGNLTVNGNASVSGTLSCSQPPSAATHVTNKTYTDGTFLKLTGGTLTGALTIQSTLTTTGAANIGGACSASSFSTGGNITAGGTITLSGTGGIQALTGSMTAVNISSRSNGGIYTQNLWPGDAAGNAVGGGTMLVHGALTWAAFAAGTTTCMHLNGGTITGLGAPTGPGCVASAGQVAAYLNIERAQHGRAAITYAQL